MIIIFVLVITIIVLYVIINPIYLPSFLKGKDLTLGDIRAENVYLDTLTYRNAYITSLSPQLNNNVPAPLDNAPNDGGTWTTGLEGYPGTYVMRSGRQDTFTFQVKPPKGWKANTPVSVRLHFTPSDDTAGDLDFRLWHKAASVSQAYDNTFSNVRINKSVMINSSNIHLTALFPDISLTGETEQAVILFALERQANGGDSSDTYGADINAIQVEVMFQISKPGTLV